MGKNVEVLLVVLTSLLIDVIGSDDKRSVAFVIDDTYSMYDDIEQVKSRTNQVFDAVLTSDVTKFEEFVLVRFNDPATDNEVTEVMIKTSDPNEFKRSLAKLIVHGGDDCPEMAMSGILHALKVCPSNSVIYVFTDASAKDYDKFEEVKSLSQKKSIQVTFLLTGICSPTDFKSEKYLVYHKIAEATSGQVFQLGKSNVAEVIEYIIQSLKSQRNLIAHQRASDCPVEVPFTVDDKTSDVMVSASIIWQVTDVHGSGELMSLRVVDLEDKDVESYYIVNLPFIKILKLRDSKIGHYKAKLDCHHDAIDTSLSVTGTTTISFEHGFSQDEPTSIKETSTLPVPGEKSFLTIALDNPNRDVTLNTVELIDVDGNVLQKAINLKLVQAEQQLYTTAKIVLPDKMFKIKVNGYTKTKEPVTRVGTTYIEPQKNFGTIDNKSPKVTIIGDTEIITESIKPVTLKCNVEAYPKPEIVWENNEGQIFQPKVITVDATGQFKSILQIGESNENATYYCRAQNLIGKAEANVIVKRIEEPPVIKTIKQNIYGIEKDVIEIPCTVIKGNPKPKVEWFKNYKNISYDSRYQILGDDNILRFTAEVSDSDDFTCVAENRVGSYKINCRVTVHAKPVIESEEKDTLNIAENETIDIPCNAKGNPRPNIQWMKHDIDKSFTYRGTSIPGHNLRFKATTSHSGYYTCEASNHLGVDRKTIYVNVYVPVRVDIPEKTTITISKGDLLQLRCSASGYPKPVVKLMFISMDDYSSTDLRQGLPGEPVTFMEKYAKPKRTGLYICLASNDFSSSNFTYTVEVKAPTKIKDLYINTCSAVAGDLVLRIPCQADGNPKPSVTWFYNGLKLPYTDIDEDGSLVLTKPDSSLGGSYTCAAENYLHTDYKTVEVEILPYPETSKEIETLIEEGKPSLIPCNIPHTSTDLVRWFKDGKEVQIGELWLKNPSIRDNGLYACRVSNEKASNTGCAKVIVGLKPRFISPDPTAPIEYIEGSDAFLDCSAQAEPAATIVWTHQGKRRSIRSMDYKITNMKPEHVGDYRCTVSNSFGKITRDYRIKSGECQLSLSTDFTGFQPLMLTESFRWPQLEVQNEFISVPVERPLILLCPESSFNYPGFETTNKVKAVCIQDSIFNIGGKQIKFSELKCKDEVVAYAKPNGIPCLPSTNKRSELYSIGYQHHGSEFNGVYEICFDIEDSIPVFSRHGFIRSVSDALTIEERPFINNVDLPHDFMKLYDPSLQIRALSSLMGKEFESNSCHFAKKQLVIPKDVVPGLAQIATYNYLNVVPHWSPCYQQNWAEVENKVRKLILSLRYSVFVWTGTFGRMRLPGQKVNDDVYLQDDLNNKLYVPLYLWKMDWLDRLPPLVDTRITSVILVTLLVLQLALLDLKNDMVITSYMKGTVAIIQINIPSLDENEAQKYVKCSDICHEITWLQGGEWHNVKKGYIFCCNIIEFENEFNFKGMFQGNRMVWRM